MNNTNERWTKWFAWHPVVVRGRMVWMRTIQRLWLSPSIWDGRYEGCWLYRPLAPKMGNFKVRTNTDGTIYIYAEGAMAFKRAVELLPLTKWEIPTIPSKKKELSRKLKVKSIKSNKNHHHGSKS